MKKILLQLDTDIHASSFDAVTAIDAGVDQLLSYSNVTPSNVNPLVQGGIFTRSPEDLKNTAAFVGGSNVDEGEQVLKSVLDCFFGPMRISVMMDSNGCNTTAAAAVVHIKKQMDLEQVDALILGGTGPVGSRVARILNSQGAKTTIVSRRLEKAEQVCSQINKGPHSPQPAEIPKSGDYSDLLQGKNVVVAAGAAGIQFVSLETLATFDNLKVAIDLNAVPPLGIQGIKSTDKARKVDGLTVFGAVGVGGLKMRIHHALVAEMFRRNDLVFDTDEIYQAAVEIEASR